MHEEEFKQKMTALEQKLDAIYISTEKTRKYFLAVLVISILAFMLPLVGLVFAIPSFLSTLTSLPSF